MKYLLLFKELTEYLFLSAAAATSDLVLWDLMGFPLAVSRLDHSVAG